MACMLWNLLFVAMFVVIARVIQARGTETYQMDVDAANEICGHSVEIPPDGAARITSAGKAPSGYCSLLFFTMNNDTHKCDSMCVSMNKTRVDVCTVKVVFSGIHFASADKSVHKELSCWHKPSEPLCLSSTIMRVEIIEKHHYAFHSSKRSYELDGTVYPKCHKLAPGETLDVDGTAYSVQSCICLYAVCGKMKGYVCNLQGVFGNSSCDRVSRQRREEKEKETRSYIYGIIVALCLASTFLILLLIMYCHYKVTGTRAKRNIPMPRIRKAISFSGMRNKLSFSRLNSSSSGKSPKSPNNKHKEKFKFEEEKHETAPLFVAGTAAAVALEGELDRYSSQPEVAEQPAYDFKADQSEPSPESSATVVDVEPTVSAD